ncbi:MAG: uroporphyrinogen-III synthase [Saprospiraceae bacterium]
MSKRIFITRSQTSESYFYALLTQAGHEVIGESLIDFSPIPFILPKDADVLFFYSRKGVQYFFSQIKQIPKMKFACMGQGTADELIKINIIPDFIGDGNPKKTAELFKVFLGERKAVFIHAENSKKSIQKILNNSINHFGIIAYSNQKKKEFNHPNADVLVFTSPMNVEAYFNFFSIKKEKIIAIGNTTANKLKELKINNFFISDFPSEKSLAEKVFELI